MPHMDPDNSPSAETCDKATADLDMLMQQGVTCHLQGEFDKARQFYKTVLAAEPDHIDALHHLGLTALQTGNFAVAADLIGRAVALKPNFAAARYNLGNALRSLSRMSESLANYKEAVALSPDFAEAHFNLGSLLLTHGRLDGARASLEKAFALNPEQDFLLGALAHTRMRMCEWAGFAESVERLKAGVSAGERVSAPFALLALFDEPQLHKRAAEIYVAAKYPRSKIVGGHTRCGARDKIRIGYYSANFHRHAIGNMVADLFECHDRTKFELFGFSFGPNKQDETRSRISSALTQFIDVRKFDDLTVAQVSREIGIDIAVDLAGHLQDGRLGIFAERCAPVQVNYFGYPGTMGADYFDYIVADETVVTDLGHQDFTEKVLRLPRTYMVNGATAKISGRPLSRAELGLPDPGFVFCSFNNNYKILPNLFDVWMRLLKCVEDSVFWLLKDNSRIEENLRREAEARGVDGQRLVFAGRVPIGEHLARHRTADLFLDTFPYNAHTTASDALRAGLPLLTCAGRSFASRVAASLLTTAGMQELITSDLKEYEAKALELATNRPKLLDIRRRLETRIATERPFDPAKLAPELETAFRAIHQRRLAGLPPESLKVKSLL